MIKMWQQNLNLLLNDVFFRQSSKLFFFCDWRLTQRKWEKLFITTYFQSHCSWSIAYSVASINASIWSNHTEAFIYHNKKIIIIHKQNDWIWLMVFVFYQGERENGSVTHPILQRKTNWPGWMKVLS